MLQCCPEYRGISFCIVYRMLTLYGLLGEQEKILQMTSSKSSDCSSKFLVEASLKDCIFSLNFTLPRREFDFTAKPEEIVINL